MRAVLVDAQGLQSDWATNHRLNILVQTGEKAQADLPDVPVLIDLVSNPDDKQFLRLLEFPGELGRPFLMPPEHAEGHARRHPPSLRRDDEDSAFLADAKKTMLEVAPVSGEEMQQIIVKAYATPDALVKKAAPFSGIPGT